MSLSDDCRKLAKMVQTWHDVVVPSRHGDGKTVATGKAQSPTVDNRVQRTISDDTMRSYSPPKSTATNSDANCRIQLKQC